MRGIDVSYESIGRWTAKVGPQIARNLRQRWLEDVWYLDEGVIKVGSVTAECGVIP
ncbi:hypothetical protein [Ruegeria profundi]|uniref:hypothetical protein n=1 Tax=Ruegeria profundi TaxID=1685378 RepID=UPI00384EB07C